MNLGELHRRDYGRILASLIRVVRDFTLAEDALQDAFAAAHVQWAESGVPGNPVGWLLATARHRAIDQIRRRELHARKQEQIGLMIAPDELMPAPHDTLRLIFTCCHPALAPEARVALTLRLLGGLTVAEIAQAFLVPETTMAQRITRAKKKISVAKIPYRVPEADDLPRRLAGVLAVVYLVFNEGYLSSSADAPPIREELTAEAIRLGRILRQLLPDVPEVAGLLALMLLTESRRTARVARGELVPMYEQDRGAWDRSLIAEGHGLVRECLAAGRPGPYQLQAAINAVHTDAPTASATDWSQVAALYDQLRVIAPSPFVELNRAVAIAELDGPEVALAIVDRLDLAAYHAWHATRADLLRRLGRSAESRAAYDAAIAATDNVAEVAYLSRRRDQLAG